MKPQSKPIEDMKNLIFNCKLAAFRIKMSKTYWKIIPLLLLFSCSAPEQPEFKQKNLIPPTVPGVLIPLGFHGSFDPISLPQAQNMIITGSTIELHCEGNQDGLKNVYHYNINNPKVHFDSTIITITEKKFIIVISKIVNSQDLYVTIKKPNESILLGKFLKQ